MRLVTTGGAERETKISRWTWRRWIADGTITGLRRGSRWYLDLDAVAEALRVRGEGSR